MTEETITKISDAEQARIELAMIHKKLDFAIRLLADDRRPNMTKAAFAKKAGVHRATVNRWIQKGLLRMVNGRIPHAELNKVTTHK
jgi:DNA invertase Pin-like site-specific DNA recombinase